MSARLCAQRSTTATENFAPIDYQLSTHLNKVCGPEGASTDGINGNSRFPLYPHTRVVVTVADSCIRTHL